MTVVELAFFRTLCERLHTVRRRGVDQILSRPSAPALREPFVTDAREYVRPVHPWGGNCGYDVPRQHINFAHRLVESGIDIVDGHSSHHVRPIEIYRDRLILYGCGDFIDDYEGILGYEKYRDDLTLMFFPSLSPQAGRLLESVWHACVGPRTRRPLHRECE